MKQTQLKSTVKLPLFSTARGFHFHKIRNLNIVPQIFYLKVCETGRKFSLLKVQFLGSLNETEVNLLQHKI